MADQKENKNKKTTKNNSKKSQKPKSQNPKSSSDFSFKPSPEVKGLKFGGQFIIKSFTIRQARTLELLNLLSFPTPKSENPQFSSTTAFLPTNFTILAHHAWHTLTLGLGTRKSKVVMFVFESETMKNGVASIWPREIPLGDVNKKLIRGLGRGCEMARFKFRKGCITFYVYAVRNAGNYAFESAEELKLILQSVVALKDFLDHTSMLALPNQRTINFQSCPPSPMSN